MSGLRYDSQKPQTANNVDTPPPYDYESSYQPRKNELVSVIENERLRRKIRQQMDNMVTAIDSIAEARFWNDLPQTDYLSHAQFYLDSAHVFKDAVQRLKEMGKVLQSRKPEHVELYTILSRLSDDELDLMLYASYTKV
ncbi:uncharacterized protein N7483_004864 [Penicillium malachiteum]|uniref:uncharacterized protein n=1 Tax=Penicillium malachiteum TaxID=1324776 RepID=UPI002548CA95|nr:uncharacterized protein N7483_004864 [Penicillium malachiteum]KAJ5730356.1 hypothetical protein N7483_004864 [Penicillium malachiteum]